MRRSGASRSSRFASQRAALRFSASPVNFLQFIARVGRLLKLGAGRVPVRRRTRVACFSRDDPPKKENEDSRPKKTRERWTSAEFKSNARFRRMTAPSCRRARRGCRLTCAICVSFSVPRVRFKCVRFASVGEFKRTLRDLFIPKGSRRDHLFVVTCTSLKSTLQRPNKTPKTREYAGAALCGATLAARRLPFSKFRKDFDPDWFFSSKVRAIENVGV